MKREECCDECESLEPAKITATQSKTGSQNLRKIRSLGMTDESRNTGGGAMRM